MSIQDYLREATEAWAADMAIEIDECLRSGEPFPDEYVALHLKEADGDRLARRRVRMVERCVEELRRPHKIRRKGAT